MKTKLTFALMAILTSTAFASFPAPLPEFKNEKQLAEWRAEMAAKDTPQTTTEDTAFYTGKPYLESSGSYAFKYRSYNPELARWTSEDPSGFPDGANNTIYAPVPTSSLDFAGLWTIEFEGQSTRSNSTNGTINVGGFNHIITSTTSLVGVHSSRQRINVECIYEGTIAKTSGANEYVALGSVNYIVSVNNDGVISIDYDSGGFNTAGGDLQIGASWSKEIKSDKTAILTAGAASHYQGNGITGVGFQASAFEIGGGASVSWTNPAGKQDSGTTLHFKAVE